MPALLIRQRIKNMEMWTAAFAGDRELWRANGSLRAWVFRNASSAHEIWLLQEWDDLFRARLFVQSDAFIDAMIRAGVPEQPEVWYLEDLGAVPIAEMPPAEEPL